MFKFFQKKCPVCKMKLDKDKDYPKLEGKELCSDNCRSQYKQKLNQDRIKSASRGCCG